MMDGIKYLSFRAPEEMHRQFAMICASDQKQHQEKLYEVVAEYLDREKRRRQRTLDGAMPFMPPLNLTCSLDEKSQYVTRHMIGYDGRPRPEAEQLISHLREWVRTIDAAARTMRQTHTIGGR